MNLIDLIVLMIVGNKLKSLFSEIVDSSFKKLYLISLSNILMVQYSLIEKQFGLKA